MKWSTLFPIVGVFTYECFNLADLIFLIDLYGVLNIKCCFTWIQFLKPIQVKLANRTQKDVYIICYLGCSLTQDELVTVFRELQLLCNFFNLFVGHFLCTIHHASLLMFSTLGTYICIRYPERLLVPGYQLAPAGVLISLLIEYVEMICLDGTKDQSEDFIRRLKEISETGGYKMRKLRKYVKTLHPLKSQLAYPFYEVNRQSFLMFHSKVIDLLVTIFVSTT